MWGTFLVEQGIDQYTAVAFRTFFDDHYNIVSRNMTTPTLILQRWNLHTVLDHNYYSKANHERMFAESVLQITQKLTLKPILN